MISRPAGREAADFRRAGAGRKGGIEAVDIKGQIDRIMPDLARTSSMSGVNDLYQHSSACTTLKPCWRGQSKSSGGIAGAAQADLDTALVVEQAFLHSAAERRAMGDLLAEHRVIDIGMGIDMDEADRSMLFRIARRIGKAMVWSPPSVSGLQPVAEDAVIGRLE